MIHGATLARGYHPIRLSGAKLISRCAVTVSVRTAAGVAFANPELAREALPEQVRRWLRPVASEDGHGPPSAVVQRKGGPKSAMLDPS